MGGDIFSTLMSISRKGPLGNFKYRFCFLIYCSPLFKVVAVLGGNDMPRIHNRQVFPLAGWGYLHCLGSTFLATGKN